MTFNHVLILSRSFKWLLITVSKVALSLEKSLNCNKVSVYTNKFMPHATKLPAWSTAHWCVVTCTQLCIGQGYDNTISWYAESYINQLSQYLSLYPTMPILHTRETASTDGFDCIWLFTTRLIMGVNPVRTFIWWISLKCLPPSPHNAWSVHRFVFLFANLDDSFQKTLELF